MAKRFIDTGLFDDEWFMDLSKDAKILWLYFITKCDHAGMLKVNEKLCKVQTDIKDLHGVIKQLGNRLVTVSEQFYFIPKYIDFQYPGFPNSKVRQQSSALEILKKHGLYTEEGLSVSKELSNTYDNDNDNDNVYIIKGAEKELNIVFEVFWNLYDKKEDRQKCEVRWRNLKDSERQKCIEALPAYIESTPDKQYRKNPATYLNNKSWENEIVKPPTPGLRPVQKFHVLLNLCSALPRSLSRT
jgi:hypothetical protein